MLKLMWEFVWRFLILYVCTLGVLVVWTLNQTVASILLGGVMLIATCAWWTASKTRGRKEAVADGD